MRVKGIVVEDFVNYKEPSLFISSCFCDWKCCHDGGFSETVCQNNPMAKQPIIDVPDETICKLFSNNLITQAFVIGGLEPMLQFDEVLKLVNFARFCNILAPFVIYTGYNREELQDKIVILKKFKNIIIKFGRYVPGEEFHFDEVLGVNLASHNQYAEIIS